MNIKPSIKNAIEAVPEAAAAGLIMYYGSAPQGKTHPYGVFVRRAGSEFGNNIVKRSGWALEYFQIDLLGLDDDALEEIRNAIIRDIHAKGPVTWTDVVVKVALITDAQDLSELENEGGASTEVRHNMDLMIKYVTE